MSDPENWPAYKERLLLRVAAGPVLPPIAYRVHAVLLAHLNQETGTAWPSHMRVARWIGIDVGDDDHGEARRRKRASACKTVAKGIGALWEAGYWATLCHCVKQRTEYAPGGITPFSPIGLPHAAQSDYATQPNPITPPDRGNLLGEPANGTSLKEPRIGSDARRRRVRSKDRWSDQDERDAYAQRMIAEALAGEVGLERAWQIIMAAESPTDLDHIEAVRLCWRVAREIGVGWVSPERRKRVVASDQKSMLMPISGGKGRKAS